MTILSAMCYNRLFLFAFCGHTYTLPLSSRSNNPSCPFQNPELLLLARSSLPKATSQFSDQSTLCVRPDGLETEIEAKATTSISIQDSTESRNCAARLIHPRQTYRIHSLCARCEAERAHRLARFEARAIKADLDRAYARQSEHLDTISEERGFFAKQSRSETSREEKSVEARSQHVPMMNDALDRIEAIKVGGWPEFSSTTGITATYEAGQFLDDMDVVYNGWHQQTWYSQGDNGSDSDTKIRFGTVSDKTQARSREMFDGPGFVPHSHSLRSGINSNPTLDHTRGHAIMRGPSQHVEGVLTEDIAWGGWI